MSCQAGRGERDRRLRVGIVAGREDLTERAVEAGLRATELDARAHLLELRFEHVVLDLKDLVRGRGAHLQPFLFPL